MFTRLLAQLVRAPLYSVEPANGVWWLRGAEKKDDDAYACPPSSVLPLAHFTKVFG